MQVKKSLPRLTALAAAALLAACGTVAPSDPAPSTRLPASFKHAQPWPAALPGEVDWWHRLGDPALAELVQRGLSANLDVQQAAERVQRSRALARADHAALGTRGGLLGGAVASQASAAEALGLKRGERRSNRVSAGLDLSWEIDLFGRLQQQSLGADARVRVSEAEVAALRLAVAAEIAGAWFALAGAREQSQVTLAVIDARRQMLRIVEARYAAGAGSPFDVTRARAELDVAEAEVPVFRVAADVAMHRIAVLVGEVPSEFEVPPQAPIDPEQIRLALPAPADWLQARPDVRAAEATLQAHAFDVAAVRAEFMPRVSITGFVGLVAGSVVGVSMAADSSWFAAPLVSLPLFDRPRIKARLEGAQAQQREALLAYRQRVLMAVEEVENRLAQVQQGQLQLRSLHQRLRQASAAQEIAQQRFRAGASDLLEWLDAQRSAAQAELQLSTALTQQRQQIVGLLHAIGAPPSELSLVDERRKNVGRT